MTSNSKLFEKHYSSSVLVKASPEDVFNYIDEHKNFSSHMNKSSWMMGGGSMQTRADENHGQKVGSHIQMSGKVFGITIFLDEIITKHEAPHLKVWETVGNIKLMVIGHYRMSVEIKPKDKDTSELNVSIDYNLPSTNAWLGQMFGGMYAKWCVSQMLKSTQNNFK